MLEIVKAKETDLKEIAKVHIACFPNQFSSAIGEKLLSKYYLEFLHTYPDLFLLAKNDNKLVGFVMGYLNDRKVKEDQLFKKHNRLKLFFKVCGLLLIFDKRAYKKVFKRKSKFSKDYKPFPEFSKANSGSLLSICVLDSYRGKGIAQELEVSFVKNMLLLNKKYVVLSTWKGNNSAVKFYEKCSYRVRVETDKDLYFIKQL